MPFDGPDVLFCAETVDEQGGFVISLENVPADVVLEEVWINGNLMSETPEGGFRLRPVLRANGSQAYELQLPFEDPVVSWKVSARPDVGFKLCTDVSGSTEVHVSVKVTTCLSNSTWAEV